MSQLPPSQLIIDSEASMFAYRVSFVTNLFLSTGERVNRVYVLSGLLFGHSEQNYIMSQKTNPSGDNHTKWIKSGSEKYHESWIL